MRIGPRPSHPLISGKELDQWVDDLKSGKATPLLYEDIKNASDNRRYRAQKSCCPELMPLFVYAFYAPLARRMKIGRTHAVQRRFASLQSFSPCALEIVWSQSAKEGITEEMLHQHFADVRSHGEWFDLTPTQFTLGLQKLIPHPRKVLA